MDAVAAELASGRSFATLSLREAAKLAGMFRENFQQFAENVTAEIRAAGPQG